MEYVPPMHFTSVDLPAPLSPTSAVPSPAWASNSTSCRTWTVPKDLFTARNFRIGSSDPAVRGASDVVVSVTSHLSQLMTPSNRTVEPEGSSPNGLAEDGP